MDAITIVLAAGVAFMVVLMIWSDYEEKVKLYHIDYVYCARHMLIKAISDYNVYCIRHDLKSSISFDDLMDMVEAWDIDPHSFTWQRLISDDKLELLKPYLPENPEKHLKQMVKKVQREAGF